MECSWLSGSVWLLFRPTFEVVTAAAIFDLDNTLVRGSSLFHFGIYLTRVGAINPFHVLRHMGSELAYVRQGGERGGTPAELAKRILQIARGRSESEMRAHASAFVGRHLREHLIASALAEVMAFQFRKVPVFLATASPQGLAEAIAAELGLAGAIGTVAEVRDGKYTGLLASPVAHGPQKASRVQALMADRDFVSADCWAFTDSINDLPLLASVGHAVAVNPDRQLRRLAVLNEWRILPGSGSAPRPVRARVKESLR